MSFTRSAFMRRLRGLMFGLPGMLDCREFEAFMLDYLDGQLPAPQAKVFERHLRMCPECQVYLAAYRTTVELGKAAFEEGDDGSLPDDVPEDLIGAILAARAASDGLA